MLTLDFAGITNWFESASSTQLFPDLEQRILAIAPESPIAIHLPGPLTMLGSASGVEGVRLWDVLPLRPIGARAVGRLARELALRIKALGFTPLVVLDEPMASILDATNPANLFLLEEALTLAREVGARVGVHWCCEPPLDVLLNIDLDYASIDLVRYGDVALARRRTLNRWLARDRVLVLGVVNAADPTTDHQAPDLLRSLSLPKESAILVAPTCGTSKESLERELDVAHQLQTLVKSMKEPT